MEGETLVPAPRPRATGRYAAFLPWLLVFATACFAYREILDTFFTGTDALTVIETSRLDSLDDVVRILGEPLMQGSGFAAIASYYRPVTSLSYGLDYAVWGLDPFGYHLTNLVLHGSVAVLLACLVSRLAGGARRLGALSGLLFASHPVLAECVPATARRHDLLATLLMLLGLSCFVRYRQTAGRRFRYLALGASALALGAKETAVVFPLLALGACWLFPTDDAPSLAAKTRWAARQGAPFFAVTVGLLLWRAIVVGLGGPGAGGPGAAERASLLTVSKVFWTGLLYPVSFLDGVPPVVAAACGFAILLFLVALGLESERRRLLLFFALWLLLGFAVVGLTGTAARRNLYGSAAPLSALLSLALASTWTDGRAKRGRVEPHLERRSGLASRSAGVALALGLGLVGTWLAYSPLFRTYRDWEENGRLASLVLHEASNAARRMGGEGTLEVVGLPRRMGGPPGAPSPVRENWSLTAYGIDSWLTLTLPGHRVRVLFHGAEPGPPARSKVRLETVARGPRWVTLTARLEATGGGRREK